MKLITGRKPQKPVRALLMDFDGTLSTLRHGWEAVMREMMLEMLSDGAAVTPDLEAEVDQYIDQSTGIQTIHQMKWLCARVKSGGASGKFPDDPWWFKDEYNRRLMRTVKGRVARLQSGETPPEEYLMAGSRAFLQAVRLRGARVYVASGTDHADVVNEARALGVYALVDQLQGAPERSEGCSKEAALRALIDQNGLSGERICVIGDGKVEIRLGREAGGYAVGLASDEDRLRGVNPVKEARLTLAGADAITGDFKDLDAWLDYLKLRG